MTRNASIAIDERSRILLKTLIERYIAEGEPVGSRTLSRTSGLPLSAATVRNIMSDLEEMGLVSSPHTSAGRTPTAAGYRFYLDSLLTVQPLDQATVSELQQQLQPDQPSKVLRQAANLLAELTHFAGIVVAPPKTALRLRQIEFVPLGEERLLIILVTTEGEVINRLVTTAQPFAPNELIEASNYLTEHYAGRSLEEVFDAVQQELTQLKDRISELMRAALAQPLQEVHSADYVVSGEAQLLDVDEFAHNMARLKELFALFERRSHMMRLLQVAQKARGVQIFIGSETGIEELADCSLITANYTVGGQLVGSIGVIGPTRMAYDRVIPIVDITAQLLSQALSLTASPRSLLETST